MKISVFGLGYVGCVSVGCLAHNGHRVIGVDILDDKVELIRSGKPTIIEKDIDALIMEGHKIGLITATTSHAEAIQNSEIALICVGTPNLPTGQLNLDYVFKTASQIGQSLREKNEFFTVVIRSTVFPGTNGKVAEIIAKESNKEPDVDFSVVSNPEFLREGNAVEDFYNPALTVIGSESKKAEQIMKELYSMIDAPLVVSSIKSAEMIKYINNSFHALKITFANEVGNICKSIGVDPFEVMRLFKMDDRLNISTAYFNPGMAYGGSCLPKDLKGLATIAHDNYVKAPVIESIEYSNKLQKERVLELIQKHNKAKIGLFGLAFKKGTDDLRFSPSIELAESLIGKGYDLKVYDKFVHLSALTGTNKSFTEKHLPHLANLLRKDLHEVSDYSDLLIVSHKPDNEDFEVLKKFRGIIIDLVNMDKKINDTAKVEGLSW